MSAHKSIVIVKAAEHNLKNISLEIPKNTLTVITGPSGSGKSSLAFDTIYVEGQRRYIESLSSYARQFLGQYSPPKVESITGLSPAIAIDQKTSGKNPRSTVGTITEIYDYLRIFFAKVGTLYCPETNTIIESHTPTKIVKQLMKFEDKTKIQILAPISINKNNSLKNELSKFIAMGFSRIRLDGEIILLTDAITTKNDKIHSIEIVIDRIIIKPNIEKRIADSVEYCLKMGERRLIALVNDQEIFFSEHNISPKTRKIYPALEPRLFSFNSPLGACTECNGLGKTNIFDKNQMILDPNLSIVDGAITPISKRHSFFYNMVLNVAEQENVDINLPYNKLPNEFIDILFNGSDKLYKYSFYSEKSQFSFTKPFSGIIKWLKKKYYNSASEKIKKELEIYINISTCPVCNGNRLNKIALSTRIGEKHIMDLCSMSIIKIHKYLSEIKFTGDKKIISEKLLKEIVNRLQFLLNVGLDYLHLNRNASSLSGGEGQRIRLATQIGSALTGVLYVLDEPSIGLHQKDNDRLIQTLKSLRDLGNTVLVVEHDEETIKSADYIVDLGPAAGINGGHIIKCGTLKEILSCKESITGKYISGSEKIEMPNSNRTITDWIKLSGACQNNIKNMDVEIPLGNLTCITGVSGSGKSTLVHEILVPAIKSHFSRPSDNTHNKYNYNSITGLGILKSVIELDQSPIGRTPQSNPATYTGLFDEIRTLFASTPESKIRGYKPGRFSFNIKGGRCEDCEGNGVKKIEMHFLPDVFITCSECNGTRYNQETLSVLYRGKNISDVLNMTIEEALEFFKNHPKLYRKLSTLNSVGLGYMMLGQPATTLSGGEAQRLKLSRELSKHTKGHCLYVLDEPTTGLHFKDIKILLSAVQQLVENNNSVLIIEHNLEVIKIADYIIDLGPDGGENGGKIVATGIPDEIIKSKKSHTGKYLKTRFLSGHKSL